MTISVRSFATASANSILSIDAGPVGMENGDVALFLVSHTNIPTNPVISSSMTFVESANADAVSRGSEIWIGLHTGSAATHSVNYSFDNPPSDLAVSLVVLDGVDWENLPPYGVWGTGSFTGQSVSPSGSVVTPSGSWAIGCMTYTNAIYSLQGDEQLLLPSHSVSGVGDPIANNIYISGTQNPVTNFGGTGSLDANRKWTLATIALKVAPTLVFGTVNGAAESTARPHLGMSIKGNIDAVSAANNNPHQDMRSQGFVDAEALATTPIRPAPQLFVCTGGLILHEKFDGPNRDMNQEVEGWIPGVWTPPFAAATPKIFDHELYGGAGGLGLVMSMNPSVRPYGDSINDPPLIGNTHTAAPFTEDKPIPRANGALATFEHICQFNITGSEHSAVLEFYRKGCGAGVAPTCTNKMRAGITILDATPGFSNFGRHADVDRWNLNTPLGGSTESAWACRMVVRRTPPTQTETVTVWGTEVDNIQDLTKDVDFKSLGSYGGWVPSDYEAAFVMEIPSASLESDKRVDNVFLCGRDIWFQDLPTGSIVEAEGHGFVSESQWNTSSSVAPLPAPTTGEAMFEVDWWALPFQGSMSLHDGKGHIIAELAAGSQVWGGSTICYGIGPNVHMSIDGTYQTKVQSLSQAQNKALLDIVLKRAEAQGISLLSPRPHLDVSLKADAYGDTSTVVATTMDFSVSSQAHGQSNIEVSVSSLKAVKEIIVNGGSFTTVDGHRFTSVIRAESHGDSLARARPVMSHSANAIAEGQSQIEGRPIMTFAPNAAAYGEASTIGRGGFLIFLDGDLAGDSLASALTSQIGRLFGDAYGGSFATTPAPKIEHRITGIVGGQALMEYPIFNFIIREPFHVNAQLLGQSEVQGGQMSFLPILIDEADIEVVPIQITVEGKDVVIYLTEADLRAAGLIT